MEPRPRRRLLSRPRQIAGESRTWFGEGLPIRRVFPDAAMRCLAVPVPADQSMTRMRYALTVNVAAWPPDIARLWREALRPHGMLAELPAGFRPEAHAAGPLIFRLAILAEAFPGAGEFGDPPRLAGFDASFERLDPVDHDRLTAECPARVRGVYRRSPCEAHFVTDERHSAIDIRLQCFAAAALAVASDGVMHDGRSGDYVLGAEAFRHAARQAARGSGSDRSTRSCVT